MKKSTKSSPLTNLLGLYLLGALVITVLVYIFGIKPLIQDGQNKAAATKVENQKITNLKQLEKDTIALKANYESVKDKRDQILSQLPVKSEEERLLVLLSNLAAQSGVVLTNFQPQPVALTPEAAASSITVYPVSITVSGSYVGYQAFQNNLENAARFVLVKKSVVGSTTNDKKVTTINARIDLEGYYQNTGTNTNGGAQ